MSTDPKEMVPKILAMIARGDRRHDIAAWFGLNQGRIKEVEDERHGTPPLAPENELPPSGSPGPKAEALRDTVEKIHKILAEKDTANVEDVQHRSNNARTEFDKNE